MTRIRTRAAAAFAALATLALAPAAFAQSADQPRITQPAFATNGKDEAPGHSYSSPTVAVDPDDPRNVYAATVDVRSNRCALLRSADGGLTWTRTKASPSPDDYPFCAHDTGFIPLSYVALGSDDTIYYLHLGYDIQDGGRAENRSVFVARSTDGGDSWQSTPVRVNRGKLNNEVEKNVPTDLAVRVQSGQPDIVYAAFNASYPNPATPARPNQPFVSVSSDGARTFGPPVNVSASYYDDANNIPSDLTPEQKKRDNFGGSNVNFAMDKNGTVYASWNRSSANITPTPPPTVTYLSKSTDQGNTWATSVIQPGNPDQTGPSGPQIEWIGEGGTNGSLHIVWEGKLAFAQGDRDVIYRRSTDGGATWSDPRTLNDDDPRQLFGQFEPTIAAAPNGRLQIAWWDMRDGEGRFVTDVYLTTSTDAGQTWSKNERITDLPINRTIGIWKPGTGGDVRQPPGLGAANALTVVMWDDTRNGTEQTETQDLFASTVQYHDLSSTSGIPRGVAIALAIAIGVAGVGLLLVIGALVLRGRRTPSAPTGGAKPDQKAPAEVT